MDCRHRGGISITERGLGIQSHNPVSRQILGVFEEEFNGHVEARRNYPPQHRLSPIQKIAGKAARRTASEYLARQQSAERKRKGKARLPDTKAVGVN